MIFAFIKWPSFCWIRKRYRSISSNWKKHD